VLTGPGKPLTLDKTRVMGILNVTPDSFSDGGLWVDRDRALGHAMEMARAGADIIDIGGESTRPGSPAVEVQQELDRVIPLIEVITAGTGLPVSIDTSKPEVMGAAVRAGAGMINDVYALRREGSLETASTLDVPVCLMHMQGKPGDMQDRPEYVDVVGDVRDFLLARAEKCESAGISRQNIIIDPGFGFGKTLQHNIDLFKGIPAFVATGYPVLVGVSRKSMLGQLSGKAVDHRMAASLSAAVLAVQAGAAIIRVHDVAETVDALKIAGALQSS
jgi:dihydropteroate synthase